MPLVLFRPLLLLFALSFLSPLWASQSDTLRLVDLRTGDLLFAATATENRITAVTQGNYDHVGIFFRRRRHPYVLEAISRGVVVTPLDSFLARYAGEEGYTHIAVGRTERADLRKSLRRALRYKGRPYDFVYLPDNEAIYCSELVQQNFVDRSGALLFAPIPMSFHDESGRITQEWQAYYAARHLPVPEGREGSNPNQLSRHEAVRLVGTLPLPCSFSPHRKAEAERP